MTTSSCGGNSNPTTKLGWAIYHLDHGWAVIPLWWVRPDSQCACGKSRCANPGKHPLGILAPHGYKNATRDAEQVQAWWSRYPQANIGGATGAASGRVVLDVDPRNGGDTTLDILTLEHDDLPDTQRHRSQSGGQHYTFKYREGDPVTEKGFEPGLDWLSDGILVVLPGSRGIKGAYTEVPGWGPGDLPLAEPPEWLLKLVRDHDSKSRPILSNDSHAHGVKLPVGRMARDFVENGAPLGQQRTRACAAARNILSAGYSVEEAANLLWRGFEACRRAGGYHPDDPWTLADAVAIASDIARRPAPPLATPSPVPEDVPTVPYSRYVSVGTIPASEEDSSSREADAEANRGGDAGNEEARCAWCGLPFWPQGKLRFCSRRCSDKAEAAAEEAERTEIAELFPLPRDENGHTIKADMVEVAYLRKDNPRRGATHVVLQRSWKNPANATYQRRGLFRFFLAKFREHLAAGGSVYRTRLRVEAESKELELKEWDRLRKRLQRAEGAKWRWFSALVPGEGAFREVFSTVPLEDGAEPLAEPEATILEVIRYVTPLGPPYRRRPAHGGQNDDWKPPKTVTKEWFAVGRRPARAVMEEGQDAYDQAAAVANGVRTWCASDAEVEARSPEVVLHTRHWQAPPDLRPDVLLDLFEEVGFRLHSSARKRVEEYTVAGGAGPP